ncbi:MAG TPA: hypothetical protein DHM37_10030 [Candidatus Cloacimonas sp.]|nr:hypothetical protein [Candidatus Cloacimonas sp.]
MKIWFNSYFPPKATLPVRVAFFITFINLINDIDNLATFYLQLFFKKLFDVIFAITIFHYEKKMREVIGV